MKKMCILKGIIISIAMTSIIVGGDINTYAKEKGMEILPRLYQFEEKNDYIISETGEKDGTIKSLGSLCINGDVKQGKDKNGIATYIVNGNEALFTYEIDLGKLSTVDSEWHLIDVKNKSVDGIKLSKDVLSGAVIVQTSLTGDNWITDKEFSDVFDANSEGLQEIYRANDVQLQNGCYYRILVVYEQERTIGQKKVVLWNTDTKEQRKIAEEYIFLAESKDKGQVSSPDTSPKHIYGKEGEVSTAVNTGKDKGYSLSQAATQLKADDPQYGWALGYFTVNGYTDKTKSDDGNYVFLKNVGDQVTLWFSLEKDITDLIGDGTLSIAEDDNGQDIDFQTKKTNFKHGTLIIRHLDSENNSKEPIIYTDYLAANARTGANTKVTLFEEGDYEVALDYEIKNSPRKIGSVDVAPSYTDYKVYFKFSIRNGNCMAYPFDKTTGSELRDGDICDEGFTLKLAGSRYNKVFVEYKAIVGAEGKKKLDSRYNKVVNEGDEFKDEGVYIFTVENQYTHRVLPKTVYIGTDPYIRAMAEGKSLSEINDKVIQGYELHEDGSLSLPEKEEVIEAEESETLEEAKIVEAKDTEIETGETSKETKESENNVDETKKETSKNVDSTLETTEVDEKEVSGNNELPIVPICVGVVVLIAGAYYLGKGKKKSDNRTVVSDLEEEDK